MTESLEEQLRNAANEKLNIVKNYIEKNHGNVNEWVNTQLVIHLRMHLNT